MSASSLCLIVLNINQIFIFPVGFIKEVFPFKMCIRDRTGILKKPVNKQTFNFDIVLSHAFSTDWGRMPLEFIQFTSEKAVEQALSLIHI